MLRTQRRIKGLARIAQWLCVLPWVEAQIRADMRRWKCSRSFLIAEIVTHHYELLRRQSGRLTAEQKALAVEIESRILDQPMPPPLEEAIPRAALERRTH